MGNSEGQNSGHDDQSSGANDDVAINDDQHGYEEDNDDSSISFSGYKAGYIYSNDEPKADVLDDRAGKSKMQNQNVNFDKEKENRQVHKTSSKTKDEAGDLSSNKLKPEVTCNCDDCLQRKCTCDECIGAAGQPSIDNSKAGVQSGNSEKWAPQKPIRDMDAERIRGPYCINFCVSAF